MVQSRQYSGNKTVRETSADFWQLFEIWGVDHSDWRIEPLPNDGYLVTWYMPYDPEVHRVHCQSQRTADANLRVCYHHVEGLQKDSLRGVVGSYAGRQYISLPPGDAPGPGKDGATHPESQRAGGSKLGRGRRLKGIKQACELLGVREDADKEIVDAAYRACMLRAHPDRGGSEEEAQRITEARELIYGRRGWT